MVQIENRAELEGNFEKRGFPLELVNSVITALEEGSFTQNEKTKRLDVAVEYLTNIGGDDMGYRLHVAVDPETNKAYLNAFDAATLNHTKGQREHTFLASSLIDAEEAHRMLKYGKKVAVNKDLFSKEKVKYNVWLSIDVDGPKDENGNYKEIRLHENYFKKRPFDLQAALADVHVPFQPVKDNITPTHLEEALKKAHLIEVNIFHNNEQQTGYLGISPAERTVDVYDKNQTLILRLEKQVKQQQNDSKPQEQNDNQKKKTWGKGQVSWKGKPNQGKGLG